MSKESSKTHAQRLNRPVHLARRDAYFERAVELLSRPIDHLSGEQRKTLLTHVLHALHRARQHAFFAMVPDAGSREKDFLRFLDLKIETVRSARAMIEHQISLEEQEGFLSNFLQAEPGEFLLPAMHFQRRAEDIIQGLWHIVRLAQAPFHRLREEVRATFGDPEQIRYAHAYRHAREEVEQRFPAAPPCNPESASGPDVAADGAGLPG